MPASPEAVALARTAALAASEKLATDIVGLDVSAQLPLSDIFLIASGANERQVHSIVDAVEEQLQRTHAVKAVRREGLRESRWSLLDFKDIIVHVFHEEDRQYYALEKLWSDCPVVDLQLPEPSADEAPGA